VFQAKKNNFNSGGSEDVSDRFSGRGKDQRSMWKVAIASGGGGAPRGMDNKKKIVGSQGRQKQQKRVRLKRHLL